MTITLKTTENNFVCVIKTAECPQLPPSIANGFVNGEGSIRGSIFIFKCQQGYSLIGQRTLYCTDKGKWNGSIPICLKGNPLENLCHSPMAIALFSINDAF